MIDNRGRELTPCRRKVAEREVRLNRAKWIGRDRIRLRFDPFAYRYIRLKVLERDKHICYWCGNPGDTMDHIVPWSKGGRTTMDNCMCACQECNGRRGDMPAVEFAHLCGVPAPKVSGGLVLTMPERVVAEPVAVAAPAPPEPKRVVLTLPVRPLAAAAGGGSPALSALLDPFHPRLSRSLFY